MRYDVDVDSHRPAADHMPALVNQFSEDQACVARRYSMPYSALRREQLDDLMMSWRATLDALPFDTFSPADRADWLALGNLIDAERRRQGREPAQLAEAEPLIGWALPLLALDGANPSVVNIDPDSAAETLHRAAEAARRAQSEAEDALDGSRPADLPRPTVAYRAAATLAAIADSLECWYAFRAGYDPAFTWWVEEPYAVLKRCLGEYADFLRKRLAGAEEADAIVGDPIGSEALREELAHAYIPYSPEELVEIAQREYAWCIDEMRRASREMGYGDDWRRAVEEVKGRHVPPGEQPNLVRALAREAIAWVEEHDLVTVPALARDCWRMAMMTPEQQRVTPFFLGGETILVSYPTSNMEHEQKRMSLRGNNRHFARATVQHELIPGHHLQMFAQARHRPYRRVFSTPFWTEGWTLHWEMLLWELGFGETPEDRVGMLFWRMHRCARVWFSLAFHLGRMTPGECVAMLEEDVGHERANAVAEVRRSFAGDYDPLYQCAYLVGGLQVHALYRELVGPGKWTPRRFHDAFLRTNCMPVALVRALLTDRPLERDFRGDWRFCEELTG